VSTYTIGEVADRSGFSPSALRYYEGIGLVAPASRTDAGYRVYDEHTLARLAFIARAKQLGCSLAEIIDLVGIWDGARCGPVQRRFHELVTDKITGAQRQIMELTALTAQLQTAASQLSGQPVDGPCGADCACVGDPESTAATATAVVVAMSNEPTDPAIACTLAPAGLPGRLADWQALLDRARTRTRAADGCLRVELDDETPLDELTRLVAAEQQCCEFFAFSITIDRRGIALEVRAPDGATDIVTSLFGAPT
jgi:MerR family transcriptional regulator, copper efflux regulator